MRPLSPGEAWALDVLATTDAGRFDALDGGIGSRLDAQLRPLIERGCIAWRRDATGHGVDVGVTDLGHLARRVARGSAMVSA